MARMAAGSLLVHLQIAAQLYLGTGTNCNDGDSGPQYDPGQFQWPKKPTRGTVETAVRSTRAARKYVNVRAMVVVGIMLIMTTVLVVVVVVVALL
eukprot:SAG11_NODE_2202_length_3695_cov_2.007508_2_plen_95_part_00